MNVTVSPDTRSGTRGNGDKLTRSTKGGFAATQIVTPREPGAVYSSPAPGSISSPFGLKACVPEQGIVLLYREGEPDPCPNCRRTAWTIGRMTAECACGFAIELEHFSR